MKHSQHTELIHNHMAIPWHHLCKEENPPITEAALPEKASIIGRTGLMLLSCGTGAWRRYILPDARWKRGRPVPDLLKG